MFEIRVGLVNDSDVRATLLNDGRCWCMDLVLLELHRGYGDAGSVVGLRTGVEVNSSG